MKDSGRILLMSALLLFGGGLLLYHYGSQLNIETDQNRMLWEQSAGDVWLYIGGLMMLISGSLSLAAVKLWLGRNRNAGGSSLSGLRKGI